jgi:NAD(P)-dependent dehydrogenase (short-subunit alcohol dehydrogenase family)
LKKMKRLDEKIAVIYGDGAVGAAVAKSFAREGARIFLTGRTPVKLERVAAEVRSAGGTIETARVDALDERMVGEHLSRVVQKAGRVDISFNTIGLPQKGIQGTALTDLSVESFMHPVTHYLTAHFITAKAAARQMVGQGHGVILLHTPDASRKSPPFVGGMVPTWAALEGFCRSLSVECGPQGVRAVCLQTTGIPETPLIGEVWEIQGQSHGITWDQFHSVMEGMTHRKKLTSLAELTSTAVFVASDEGSAILGTVLNLTAGMVH